MTLQLRTDPKLSALRRPAITNLLAPLLTGEPWLEALHGDPAALPAPIAAACIISYITRRDIDWHIRTSRDLQERLIQLVAMDRRSVEPGRWPFLDALERTLPIWTCQQVDKHLEPFRLIWERVRSPGPAGR